MNNENQQIIDANMIMKILYKNKFLIALTTVIVIILSTAFVFINKSFKSDIIMYGNDKVLTEIGENSQFSLSSFDFYSFLKKNSKTLRNVNLPEDKFFKEMTTRLTAQSETNDPTIKIKFTTKDIKMLFSKKALKEDKELVQLLMVSKEDYQNLKYYNFFCVF